MIVEDIHIRTYGGSNPTVKPIFSAELHPSAESVFDSPKIIQDRPVVPTTGPFQLTQTFPYVAWRFITIIKNYTPVAIPTIYRRVF